jgi:group I intron endonuclease
MIICKALRKYGHYNFSLEILQYCGGSAHPSDVISREQFYLDLLNPEYNIFKIAGSSRGFKHTKETLQKMIGRTQKKETNNKISEGNKGKIYSETKVKMSEIKKGKNHPLFGKTPTEETRAKISEKLGHVVEVLDLETNITTVYDSIGKAALSLAASYTTLSRYIKGQKLYQDRFQIVKKSK